MHQAGTNRVGLRVKVKGLRFSYCIIFSKRCKAIVDRLNTELLSNFQIKPSQKLRMRGRAWHVAFVMVGFYLRWLQAVLGTACLTAAPPP